MDNIAQDKFCDISLFSCFLVSFFGRREPRPSDQKKDKKERKRNVAKLVLCDIVNYKRKSPLHGLKACQGNPSGF